MSSGISELGGGEMFPQRLALRQVFARPEYCITLFIMVIMLQLQMVCSIINPSHRSLSYAFAKGAHNESHRINLH